MDDFANILQRDYGLRPQGKSAPMSSVKPAVPSPFSSSSNSPTPVSIQRTSSAGKPINVSNRNSKNSTSILGEPLDEDFFFGSSNGINSASSGRNTFGSAASDIPVVYDDVFGGPPKFASPSYPPVPSSETQQNSSSQLYDDIFRMPVKPSSSTSSSSNKASTFPVFDAPLYDDDIFGGVPGIKSASVVYDDVFSGGSTVGTSPTVLEDLLGVSESRDRSSGSQQPAFDSSMPSAGVGDFDDLLPGFGGTEPAKPRPTGGGKFSQHNSSGLDKDSHGMSPSDPFDVLQVDDPFSVPQSAGQSSASPFSDSDASKIAGSHRRRYSNSEYDENIDASGNSSPHISTVQSPSRESRNPYRSKNSLNSAESYATVLEENHSKRNQSSSNQAEEQTRTSSSPKPQYAEYAEVPSFHSSIRRTRQVYGDVEDPVHLPKAVENRHADEFWISVEDVKLVTEPTAAPPPSRRPPLPGLKHGHMTRKAAGSKAESNQGPVSSFKDSPSRHESPQSTKLSSSRGASEYRNRSNFNNAGNMYDELEEFASGVSRARKETKMDMSASTLEEEIMEGSAAASASAMAMKEAMERARSKLQDREKEEKDSGLRVEEAQEDLDEAKEDEEEKTREIEEKERVREREEREREAKALREREEQEKRRREREKEKEREREREREKDRIAVERATQEARERAERVAVERATAEARERAAAEARQRAAVERVTAEARERAAAEARDRAAVERATAEARERAAAEARERAATEARERAAAERATAEARERAASEAREKAAAERAASEARARAERSFVERVNEEARERAAEKAAADARERAERAAAERASAAREQQRRSENDLDAFFASNSRPGSVPRQRSPAKGTSSDGRQPSKGFSTEGSQRNSTAAPGVRKVTPTSSADDWTSLFGPAVPAASEFQDIEGESAERRRARWDRQQRTAERAAKALDEKNQRDLQSQRDQAERHRAGDMLDAEIKRWAAGKEGNLRALLSTLQYVLWPECGWQAASLSDLITAAAVKKVYRKATLCVHPDKVQQKGATIQQKYIAEKVFDLLKEAWNKFNSEELF